MTTPLTQSALDVMLKPIRDDQQEELARGEARIRAIAPEENLNEQQIQSLLRTARDMLEGQYARTEREVLLTLGAIDLH